MREKEACSYADEVITIRQSHQYDITLAYSLIGIVKKNSIDILHTLGSISDLSGVVAAKATEASQAIIDLLENVKISKLYGEFGRERVLSTFALERMFGEYLELYRRLVLEK